MARLCLYDPTDEVTVYRARNWGSLGMTMRPAREVNDVLIALSGFISNGTRFGMIIFDFHGSPGRIALANDSFTVQNVWLLRERAAALAPRAHVLLLGCNVAEGERGQSFIREMARAFVANGVLAGSNSSQWGTRWNMRTPAWGILRLVETRDHVIVREAETSTLLGRLVSALTE